MFEVFLSQKHHQLWTFRPSQPVISKDLVTSFSRKKRKKIEKFEKSMIFGCFLTFLASIIIVESLKTIKHPKTVWIWRKNDFSYYFDKKNRPTKKTVTDSFFYRLILLEWRFSVGEFRSKSQSERTCVFSASPRTHVKNVDFFENCLKNLKKFGVINVAELTDYDGFRAEIHR